MSNQTLAEKELDPLLDVEFDGGFNRNGLYGLNDFRVHVSADEFLFGLFGHLESENARIQNRVNSFQRNLSPLIGTVSNGCD